LIQADGQGDDIETLVTEAEKAATLRQSSRGRGVRGDLEISIQIFPF